MKQNKNRYYVCLFLVFGLLSCTSTPDFLNEIDTKSINRTPKRSASIINNALVFDSMEDAEATLAAMQTVDNANEFYNTYIRNSTVHNKYLTSIHEYISILNMMESGDSITALEALEALKDSLFNTHVEDEGTIVEPLSYFDYRCLVNEDDEFFVNDRVYHLFDTIFISCPIENRDELISISQNPLSLSLLISQLKRDSEDLPLMRGVPFSNNGVFELTFADWRHTNNRSNRIKEYEKIVDKHRMRVFIGTEEYYSSLFDRHDLKTMYMIKSHKKCLGIWWIKNEFINVDIKYDAIFAYGATNVEMVPLSKSISIDSTYSIKGFTPSYKKVLSYPNSHFTYMSMRITNENFTISNPYMTITETNLKSINPN